MPVIGTLRSVNVQAPTSLNGIRYKISKGSKIPGGQNDLKVYLPAPINGAGIFFNIKIVAKKNHLSLFIPTS